MSSPVLGFPHRPYPVHPAVGQGWRPPHGLGYPPAPPVHGWGPGASDGLVGPQAGVMAPNQSNSPIQALLEKWHRKLVAFLRRAAARFDTALVPLPSSAGPQPPYAPVYPPSPSGPAPVAAPPPAPAPRPMPMPPPEPRFTQPVPAPRPAPAPPPPPPAPQPAPPPKPTALTDEERAVAQALGIPASRASIDKLIEEMNAVHVQNALGPGVQQPRYVSQLQEILTRLGYPVPVTGQFDEATTQAVLKFKGDNPKPHFRLEFVDGSSSPLPFVDEATKAMIIFKFEQMLGPEFVGHVDELGILRPSQAWKDMLHLTHSWVYDQPFRDAGLGSNVPSPEILARATEAKLKTGRFLPLRLSDGRVIPIFRAR